MLARCSEAERRGFAYLDLHDLLPAENFIDSLHLNAAGYQVWANTVLAWTKTHLPNTHIGTNDFSGLGPQPSVAKLITPLIQGNYAGAPKHFTVTETSTGDIMISSTTFYAPNVTFQGGTGSIISGVNQMYINALTWNGGGSILKAGNGSFQFQTYSVVPGSDNAQDLGVNASVQRWRNLFLAGSIYLPNISGTQCLHVVSGQVVGTGADCGSGGGGATTKTWNAYAAQTASVAYLSRFIPVEGITIKRMSVSLINGATCTVSPTIFIVDSTTSTTLTTITIPNSTAEVDSGVLSISVTGGDLLRLEMTGGTCTASPGLINVVVEYTS